METTYQDGVEKLCTVHKKRLDQEVDHFYHQEDVIFKLHKEIDVLNEVNDTNHKNVQKLKALYEDQVEETKRVGERARV